jgi:diaminohydroxyphosphoribosylaminopyrimidine deaminase/5-amino-6-(5-phosphoribosylamino)uracil reductase
MPSPALPSSPFSDLDHQAMHDALRLAQQAVGLSEPNPRVGCVLLGPQGQRAEGHTQPAGQAHAEVMALRAAAAAGWNPRGATAYVTLEPCSHHGRTPPCCDALLSAGVARVVVALQDPNPLVAGQGIGRLRAAGVQVDVGLLADEAAELNIGFLHRMRTGRPWVRLKVAASLDGRTALPDGRSQWITSEAARADGHAWRHRAGAVLTGVGTVREDDPRLDVRLVPSRGQPLRVVIDSRLETPPGARLLAPPGRVLFYAAEPPPPRADVLQAQGAEVALMPGPGGKVDLAAALADLGHRQVNELHVEAGHKLNGSLLKAGLVDELLVYLAPSLLGAGREMAAFGPLAQLQDAPRWRFTQVDPLGPDLRILARRDGPPAH